MPFFTGAKDFAIWTLPQIQYKNPNVQITTFLNQTPSPYITCYLDGGTKVLFDVYGQTKEEIIEFNGCSYHSCPWCRRKPWKALSYYEYCHKEKRKILKNACFCYLRVLNEISGPHSFISGAAEGL